MWKLGKGSECINPKGAEINIGSNNPTTQDIYERGFY